MAGELRVVGAQGGLADFVGETIGHKILQTRFGLGKQYLKLVNASAVALSRNDYKVVQDKIIAMKEASDGPHEHLQAVPEIIERYRGKVIFYYGSGTTGALCQLVRDSVLIIFGGRDPSPTSRTHVEAFLTNIHPGDWWVSYPHNCSVFYAVAKDSEKFKALFSLLESQVNASVSVDLETIENPFNSAYSNVWTQLFFRGVAGLACLVIGVNAFLFFLRWWYEQRTRKHLVSTGRLVVLTPYQEMVETKFHQWAKGVTLFSNAVFLTLLSVYLFVDGFVMMGNLNYLDANRFRFMFALGGKCGLNLMLICVWQNLQTSLEKSLSSLGVSFFSFTVGCALLLMEIPLFYLVGLRSHVNLLFSVPTVAMVLDLSISGFFLVTASRVMTKLNQMSKISHDLDRSAIKVCRLVRISAFSSLIFSVSLSLPVFIPDIPYEQPAFFLVFSALFVSTRLVDAILQLVICKPLYCRWITPVDFLIHYTKQMLQVLHATKDRCVSSRQISPGPPSGSFGDESRTSKQQSTTNSKWQTALVY